MIVELAAVRLLAPWFGTSQIVWTNVIGVILLALALGYLVGGILAARAEPVRILSTVLLVAGALVAWLPLIGAAFARTLLPEEIALHEAAELVGWGSLCVALLVFLPPALLLGTVCPLTVESLARARRFSAGRAGGGVLFLSTLGSLAGVFGTSHLLLPVLGLQRTFWLAGGLLLLAGALVRQKGSSRAARSVNPLVCLALAASAGFVRLPAPLLRQGQVELALRDSSYQRLRVVEDHTQEVPLRFLQVNEGFDSFQSVWQPAVGPLPEGFYYNDFLLPASWSTPVGPWHVLVLGLGAGTALRVLAGEPRLELQATGIELDPEVVALGQEFFDLPRAGANLVLGSGVDARVALHSVLEPVDQIVLDCYSNQVEIPAHLCTLEFFRELRARLRQDGWLTANLGGFDFEDPVVAAVASTCARAFESAVLLVRVPHSRNYLLLARKGAAPPWTGAALATATQPAILALGARRLPGFARLVEPVGDGDLLTDDRCPIERLQQRSIREARLRRMAALGS